MKEASVWLNRGQQSAIDVEGLDFMAVCTPWQLKSAIVVTTINQAARPEQGQNKARTRTRDSHCKNWSMLMDTQSTESILGCGYGVYWIVHSEIPQSYLAVSTTWDELPHATTLHMYVCDPLLMITPDFDHCCGGFETLIEYTNCSVSKPSNKNIAGDLIRGQGSNTRTGPRWYVL